MWFSRKKKKKEIEERDLNYEKGEGGSLNKFMESTELQDRYMSYISGGANVEDTKQSPRDKKFKEQK